MSDSHDQAIRDLQHGLNAANHRIAEQDALIRQLTNKVNTLEAVVTPLTGTFPRIPLQPPPTGHRSSRRPGPSAGRSPLHPLTFEPPQAFDTGSAFSSPSPYHHVESGYPIEDTVRGRPIVDPHTYQPPRMSNKQLLPFTIEDIAAKNKRVHRPGTNIPTCRICNADGILVACFRKRHWNWCAHHKRMSHIGEGTCGYGAGCYIIQWEEIGEEEWKELVKFSYAEAEGLGRRGLTKEELEEALFPST